MKATTHNTLNYSLRFPSLQYKPLGKTSLTVSACGFGSYRIDYRVQEHYLALEYALLNGINLIDTSSNYSDGGSEILIGKVLNNLTNNSLLKREEIVIVTKGGYIQGKNFTAASEMKKDGRGYPEVIEYTDNLWHCIHPDFLKDQITFSLERMQIDTIDVYLLHNPEYFLDSDLSKELCLEELRHEYYSRIKKAFTFLEEQVVSGRIGCYGISSNTFNLDESEQTFTSLELCKKAADEISSKNHFSVIEFPLNLFERSSLCVSNQIAETQTLLEYAENNNFGVFINRPLNFISSRTLIRLTDFPVDESHLQLDEPAIQNEIDSLASLEEKFIASSLDDLSLQIKENEGVKMFLKISEQLKTEWKNYNSIETFNDVKKQYLIPRANYAFSIILSSEKADDKIKTELNEIAKQINKVLSVISSVYGVKANMRSKEIHEKLNELIQDDNFKKLTLSQKTINLLTSIVPVSSVLVGMRQKKYVDDVLSALKAEQTDEADKILMKLEI